MQIKYFTSFCASSHSRKGSNFSQGLSKQQVRTTITNDNYLSREVNVSALTSESLKFGDIFSNQPQSDKQPRAIDIATLESVNAD